MLFPSIAQVNVNPFWAIVIASPTIKSCATVIPLATAETNVCAAVLLIAPCPPFTLTVIVVASAAVISRILLYA